MTTASAETHTECIWDTPTIHVFGVTRQVDGAKRTIGCFAYTGKATTTDAPRGINREQHFELAK